MPVLFLTARDDVERPHRRAHRRRRRLRHQAVLASRSWCSGCAALLRRSAPRADHRLGDLVVGDLVLDEDSHEVRRGGDLISLTATEFELLRFLMRNPRRVLSKAQILDRVWNYDFGGQANVVELYISYLRKKIDAGRRTDDPHHEGLRLCPQARHLSASRPQCTAGTAPAARRPLTLRAKLIVGIVGLITVGLRRDRRGHRDLPQPLSGRAGSTTRSRQVSRFAAGPERPRHEDPMPGACRPATDGAGRLGPGQALGGLAALVVDGQVYRPAS